ncbi:MAG: hypothetical protein IPN89_00105 [Saprospiraceae bacterium]|nr:hypothetical protein [Saprospiraceae bacterium]
MFSDLAGQGVGLGASLLNNIKIILELQADGDIKVKGSLISLGLSDATWGSQGRRFSFKNTKNGYSGCLSHYRKVIQRIYAGERQMGY